MITKHFLEVISETKHPLEVVSEQALDKELWFETGQSTEVYFQEELRRLHAAVENFFERLPTEEELKEVAREYPIDDLGDSTENAAAWGMGVIMGYVKP